MFLAHSFRLRDPWQCERTEDGGTRWSRGFHRPTGMEPDDDLWLVCSGLPPGAAVSMNNHRLPLAPDVRKRAAPAQTPRSEIPSLPNQFDVTAILADVNRIEIAISSAIPPDVCGPQPSSFPYDIRLGIVGHS
jgi:hypothetical protein